jgi:hypothetical protein
MTMLKKDKTIRGETILQTLTPEMTRVLNDMPLTGSVTITITMKDHRLTGMTHNYSQGEPPEGGDAA